MRIGIIGAGSIGATLARHLVRLGHEVAIANSRGPGTLADLAAELGERGRAATAADAALFGEVVVAAIPFGRYEDLPADALEGTVLVDATNYYPDRDGHVEGLDEGTTTSSGLIAAHAPTARVVKAFNTIHWEHLRDQADPDGTPGERRAIPVAGDDEEAKRVVVHLIEAIGFDVVDAGPLADGGRRLQPGSAVYNVALDRSALRERLAA